MRTMVISIMKVGVRGCGRDLTVHEKLMLGLDDLSFGTRCYIYEGRDGIWVKAFITEHGIA